MDVDQIEPPAELDPAVDIAAEPRAKRPRVGRAHAAILGAIEADSAPTHGWQRPLRGMLLHVGESRHYDESRASVLRRQADELLHVVRTHGAAAVDLVLEAVLNLPQVTVLLAFVVSLAARLDATSPNLAHAVAQQIGQRLLHALRSGHPLHVRVLLRFAAALSAQGTVAAGSVLAQLQALVQAAQRLVQGAPGGGGASFARRAVFLVHAALAALPWWSNPSAPGEPMPELPADAAGEEDAAAAAAAAALDSDADLLADERAALRAASAWGAGDPAVRRGVDELLRDAGALLADAAAEPAPALSVRRQQQLFAWVDAPEAADGAPAAAAATLRAAALPDASKLLAALLAAQPAGDLDPCLWAVPTIARPQADGDLARALLAATPLPQPPPPPTRADTDTDAIAAASFAPAALRVLQPLVDGSGFEPEGAAEGAQQEDASASAALPPPPGTFASVPVAAAFFVKPGMQLFGPGGGLSATGAVMAALGLAHPALAHQPAAGLALWCLRDVCHDVVAAYHPFHAETAAALAAIPLWGGDGGAAGAAARRRRRQRCEEEEGAGEGGDAPPLPRSCATVLGLEALLCQMLALPASPFPEPYYALVVIAMLAQEAAAAANAAAAAAEGGGGGGDGGAAAAAAAAQAPGSATRTLGFAARVLWKFAWALDDALLPALAGWVAHHASVTRWEWLWDEWAPALLGGARGTAAAAAEDEEEAAAAHSPQRRLLQSLLHRAFALVGPWHYDRLVRERFPAALADAGALPPKQGHAAASAFFPEARGGGAPAAALTSAGAAGGGSSADAEAGDGAVAPAPAAAPVAGDAGDAEWEAADAAAVDAWCRRLARESPGCYPGATAAAMPALRRWAAALMGQVRAKADAAALGRWIRDEAPPPPGTAPSTALLAAVHAVLAYARANMRNTRLVLERYRPLLADPVGVAGLQLLPAGEAGAGAGAESDFLRANVLLDGVWGVWGRHPHVACAAAGDLVDLGVLGAGQAAQHALKGALFPRLLLPLPPRTTTRLPQGGGGGGDGGGGPAAAASSAPPAVYAPLGGAAPVPAAEVLALLRDRALRPEGWEAAAALLARAGEAAHRDGAELALFRGARVLDVKEPEADEEAAAAREAALLQAAVASRAAYRTAALQAAAAAAATARTLQAHIDAYASGGGGGGVAGPRQLRGLREALRVALAHLRDACRLHAGALTATPAARASLQALREASAAAGLEPDSDLAGAALAAVLAEAAAAPQGTQGSGAWLGTALVVPQALLRDADVPVPVDVDAEVDAAEAAAAAL